MELAEQLFYYPKTYISLETLLAFLDESSYSAVYDRVTQLIAQGRLQPVVKKNATNGRIPPLYLKYRICKPETDDRTVIEEIRHLEGAFHISFYLENQNKYIQQREIILPLSNFLKTQRDTLQCRISKNERAYQIFGYEKALDGTAAQAVLAQNDLRGLLNYYNTPEPFFYDAPACSRQSAQTVLILENKDTWYALRACMRTANHSLPLLGHVIDGLLYGEGKKITRDGALDDFCESELHHSCDFLYFGDLDYEGIAMFLTLRKKSPCYSVQLFSALYMLAIDLYLQQGRCPLQKTRQRIADISAFCACFDEAYATEIRRLLERGSYIPQEIVSKAVFDGLLSE